MNEKQNDYQNVNLTPISYLWLEIALFFVILYDLGVKKNISGVYCSSSDL